jgi:hypothetical protein
LFKIEVKREFYMKYARMLKWLSVILVIAVIIPAIGCGKGGGEATPTPMPTATVPAEPTGETGTLSDLDGDVQVQRQGTKIWIVATSGMEIWVGDSLETGDDGYVLITFFDGSVMELEADTKILVEELVAASGGSTTVRINQVIGSTLNRVENLIDSSSTYEIETLAGSAVVRGTIFRTEVDQPYSGIIHTCVNTSKEEDEINHSIAFSNLGETVNVTEGKTSCCWEGGVPGAPDYTDPDDDPANFTGGGGSLCEGCCYPCYWIQSEGRYCYCPEQTPYPTPMPTPY